MNKIPDEFFEEVAAEMLAREWQWYRSGAMYYPTGQEIKSSLEDLCETCKTEDRKDNLWTSIGTGGQTIRNFGDHVKIDFGALDRTFKVMKNEW